MRRIMRKSLYAYANMKGGAHPVHLPSLISTFVVRCLHGIIPLVSILEISSLKVASVAKQAGLSLIRYETRRQGFS